MKIITRLHTDKIALSGSTKPQTIFVPAKHRIDSIVAERRGAGDGTINIGTTYVPRQAGSNTITSIENITGPGSIIIKMKSADGTITKSVNFTEITSAADAANAIAALTFDGWGPGVITADGQDKYKVTFGSDDAPTFTGTNSVTIENSGVTMTGPTVVTAGAAADPGSKAVFGIQVTGAPSSSGSIHIDSIEVPVVGTDDAEAVAQKIYTAVSATWDAAVEGASVTLTAKTPGVVTKPVYTDTDNTGVTMTISGEATEGTAPVEAKAEVVTFTVNTGAVVDGKVFVDTPENLVIIDVSAGDTAAEVATAISGGTYEAYTTSVSDAVVTFTAKATGPKTESIAMVLTLTSNIAMTSDAGNVATVSDLIVEDFAFPTTHTEVKKMNVSKDVFSVDEQTPLYMQASKDDMSGFLHISYEKFKA